MEAVVWPFVTYNFSFILFICTYKCLESLFCLEAYGYCYTTFNGLSLRILLDNLLLSLIMEILLFWICKFVLFTCSYSS